MEYICANCGKDFSDPDLEFIRCLYCDSKILFKKTPTVLHSFTTD